LFAGAHPPRASLGEGHPLAGLTVPLEGRLEELREVASERAARGVCCQGVRWLPVSAACRRDAMEKLARAPGFQEGEP